MKFTVIHVIFLSVCCVVKAEWTCVMHGECHVTANGHAQPCPWEEDYVPPLFTNDTSIAEKEEILEILENRCPVFIFDEDGNKKSPDDVKLCCDLIQIRKMSESLLMADTVLGRCPTCLRNFVRQICEMNCSPEQSRFVDVYTEINDNGITYVNEIDYKVHEDFMVAAHASCEGVLVPQTGLPAINLMCGSVPVCDAEGWFGSTGDAANNPLVPVQVNFLMWPTEEDSMNALALPCNETYGDDLPCSCVDCVASCPIGNEPTLPDICTVISVNCIGFGVGIAVFVIGATIFAILTFIEYRRLRTEEPKPPVSTDVSKPNVLINFFQITFTKIGLFSANNPILIIMLTSWLTFAMFFGVININITSNPIELWSAPDSRSRSELNYFNTRFGPFYRAAQVYLRINLEPFVVENVTYGPAFRVEALEELVKLEDAIIDIGRDNGGVTLEQVCYAPLRSRGGEQLLEQCVSMSASTYLGDNRHNINNDTYLNQILSCLNNFYSIGCIASWGGGSEPDISFGGFEGDDILSADTLLINYPISNFLLEEDLRPVLEWEQKFLDLLHDYENTRKPDFIDVAFGAERSIQDEIERVSRAEAVPIAVSYVIMFIYVTISLGNIRYCKTWFLDSKILVAVGSILVEVVSIFCALGLMGYTGITTTLLAINVIPFFVLSIGIDNVFLMVNTLYDIDTKLKDYEDYKEDFSLDEKRKFVFSKMLTNVGPSMFISSVTQITCFAIGSLANFPAVVTFAIFATFSLAFLFIFQITTVVAILSLDYKRASQNRFDVFCCVQKKILDDENPLTSNEPYQGIIKRLMKPYSKILLKRRVKIIVAILFMGMLSVSIILVPQLEVGLDQEMALPTDSYVYKYLQAVNHLLHLGPPVYFILKSGLNFTDPVHQNTVCGGQLCYDDSLTTQIFLASRHSNITYVARSSNSWLDDYFDWASLPGSCCKYNITDGNFCPSTSNSPECVDCDIARDEWSNGLRPAGETFETYIPFFLHDPPTDQCNKGGLASYFNSVNYFLDSEGRATVYDTNFMAYHVPLATSTDYITAVKYGYEICNNITAAIKTHTDLDIEVFPYSVFYVYFEQYLTMWRDTFASIGYSLIGALFINLLATGFNITTTFAVMFTALMVVINMMGVMYIWNIPLNAVSCVNLIVSIGIAVEFCSHIGYAFATSKCPPGERVEDAIKTVGATIITGITFTNIPIIVLAFSYTEIIEVFFFRMFFSLVILGFLHGMVFFPVFLSYLSLFTKNKNS